VLRRTSNEKRKVLSTTEEYRERKEKKKERLITHFELNIEKKGKKEK